LIKNHYAKLRFACFVSSHGFGHATRVVAVIHKLAKHFNHLEILLVGQTPQWFWESNRLPNCKFSYLGCFTDVGLIQEGPFEHDLKKTYQALIQFLDFSDLTINPIIESVYSFKPNFILCDISPLGIKIGTRLKIPTILIENFTWDWIYELYAPAKREFKGIILSLKELYDQVSYRIQCRPFCSPVNESIKTMPIFREPILNKKTVLSQLNLPNSAKYILVTTGGISMERKVDKLASDFFLVVPGEYQEIQMVNKVIYLPMKSAIPFPDLVNSSVCVVGKAGYGTVAECWGMNVPFIGVFRDSFRESSVLLEFCSAHLNFQKINLCSFLNNTWISKVPTLLKCKKRSPKRINGSSQVASAILTFTNQFRK
jgi:hypothetical protein